MATTDEHGRVWFAVSRDVADSLHPLRMGEEAYVGPVLVGTVTALDSTHEGWLWVAVSPAVGVEVVDG